MDDATLREAMGLPGFRWMPGMLDTDGVRVLAVRETVRSWELPLIVDAIDAYSDPVEHHDYKPEYMEAVNISDPATAGCLLELSGWPRYELVPLDDGTGFRCTLLSTGHHVTARTGTGDTKAEAISAACCTLARARGRWPGGGAE